MSLVAFRASGVVYIERHADGARGGQIEFELNVRSNLWLISTHGSHGFNSSYGYDGTNFYEVAAKADGGSSGAGIYSSYPVSTLPEFIKLLLFSFALNRAFDSGPSERFPAPFIGTVGVPERSSYIYDEAIQRAELAPHVPLTASFRLRREMLDAETASAKSSGKLEEITRLSYLNVDTPAGYSVLNVESNGGWLIPQKFRLVHPIIHTFPDGTTELRERRFWGEVTNIGSVNVDSMAPQLTASTSVQDLRLGKFPYQYYAVERRWLTKDEVLSKGRLLTPADKGVSDLKHQELASALRLAIVWIPIAVLVGFPIYLMVTRRKLRLGLQRSKHG